MMQRTAKMSPAIVAITMIVFAIIAGLFIASLYFSWMLLLAGFMVLVCAINYLFIPVGYELAGNRLTVFTHVGRREFEPVRSCSPVNNSVAFGVRLFGNGGFFGGTGWFWNRRYGVYRAYVTSARRADMVMIESARQKILISPENPSAFLADQRAARG